MSDNGSSGRREIGNDRADEEPKFEGKSEPEPGWLADDELTHEWLELVEQYRVECDAADRQRILNDPATKGATGESIPVRHGPLDALPERPPAGADQHGAARD